MAGSFARRRVGKDKRVEAWLYIAPSAGIRAASFREASELLASPRRGGAIRRAEAIEFGTSTQVGQGIEAASRGTHIVRPAAGRPIPSRTAADLAAALRFSGWPGTRVGATASSVVSSESAKHHASPAVRAARVEHHATATGSSFTCPAAGASFKCSAAGASFKCSTTDSSGGPPPQDRPAGGCNPRRRNPGFGSSCCSRIGEFGDGNGSRGGPLCGGRPEPGCRH